MLAAWDELFVARHCTRRKLVANLPYVIATPLISNLLIARSDIERMVVMVQWEIAERLRATVGTKDYNALSVLVQSVADVEMVRKVLPTNFYPRPKVDSAIVLIRPSAEKRAKVGDVPKFRVFLRDLYVHRRKNLRQALSGWPGGRRDKAEVDAKLAGLGIDGTLRSETLECGNSIFGFVPRSHDVVKLWHKNHLPAPNKLLSFVFKLNCAGWETRLIECFLLYWSRGSPVGLHSEELSRCALTLRRLFAVAVFVVAHVGQASPAAAPAPAPAKTENPMTPPAKALDEVGRCTGSGRALQDVITDLKEKMKVPVILDNSVYQISGSIPPSQPSM